MTKEVTGFAGTFCKDADRGLVRQLRSEGLLFREEVVKHDYPFCWRADKDPLIQYARPGWFISTSRFRDQMLSNSNAIRWIPDHIREGRFGKFLETNVDWALSRQRYWGTPLPIWRCEKTGHMEAVGSYAELLSKPGLEGTDAFEKALQKYPRLSPHLRVHKPYIDAVTYRSPKDPGARMRRVPEVIDCWYDSGAMPFAQFGYPHAKGSEKKFKEAFPADFISEGIDQTRGWFYTLVAESTLVHEKQAFPHPFRTCIVTGHVCDEKGLKMSKQKRNYLDPRDVLDAHGADALRWYFLSQVQPWTNMRFSMERVSDARRDFLIRLQNVWSFFNIYARIDGFDPAEGNARAKSTDDADLRKSKTYVPVKERSLMDRWMLSELHISVREVTRALDAYDILGASRTIFDLVDHLSNWYVRASRSRFWASGSGRDKFCAYWTLYECLATIARMVAPFLPFFAEELYLNLVAGPWGDSQPESVHLTDYPVCDPDLVDEGLAERMALVLELVALGRAARVESGLRVRQPLSEAVVVLARPDLEGSLADLLPLVKDELNVKDICFAGDADKYVEYQFKPNFKLIGPRLGPLVQKLKGALATASAATVKSELEAKGSCDLDVEGARVTLSKDELEVGLSPREGYAARAGKGVVLVLETKITPELEEEWWARELVAAVNGLRGDRSLAYEARIRLQVWCGEKLRAALESNLDYLKSETLSTEVTFRPLEDAGGAIDGTAGTEPFRADLTA
jgi:isoleucyl-tRNA synthetase